MVKCQDKCVEPGIEFETSTCDSQGNIQCTVNTQDDQVYHYIKILNMRGKSCTVDAKGFTRRQQPILEFKDLQTHRKNNEWETRGIAIRGRTKNGGFGPYSGNEATVISVTTTHGEETIYTIFTYTPQGGGPSTPPDLAFEVDY